MCNLDFSPISLEQSILVRKYMSDYGAGSCQHSFVSMYSLFEKYGDAVCESGQFLYILRSHLCDGDYRVYLAPMGNGDRKKAFSNLLDDAHNFHAKAKFITLTETDKNFIEQEFPDQFIISEERDLAEYIYQTEHMATFAGGNLAKRRKEVHQFWKTYGDRASLKPIEPKDFPEILEFEGLWLEENCESHDMESLKQEARTIQKQLEHFEELQLSGIVMRIDGKVHGYGYGTRLSPEYYDALIEKGDRNVRHAYKVLRQESVKQCAMECTYVNLEEDLGIEGLRNLKNAYQPEFLIKKYIVTER